MRYPSTPARAVPASFVVVPLLASFAAAQQFQAPTAFPGSAFWSEGVECADVDQDGDLDVFVADGDGFNTAGTQRQNRLFVNQLVQGQAWTLTDESVARLGAHSSNAKGVTTGDIDGDGWVDALYANAFFTQPPFLYVNRGAAQPGFFDFEGPVRGFTARYSSGAAAFGDLDDDGDLDVILNDRYNSASSARPHLFFNDGTGHFTENAAALGAPLKSQQMDVQLVDIDGDWDVDFFGPNKFSHYLMLNNGTGTFSDVSSLTSGANGSTYEAEAGDLDGDLDLDLFFTSVSGFSEAVLRANLVPSGTLSFTNQPAFGGDDDNEVVLFDHDMDGDLDVIIGSLRAGSDKLYRNDGNLVLVDQSTLIPTSADATLDATVADLDNDGRYDLITVQGESGNFTNKRYRSVGPVDARAPSVRGVLAPTGASASAAWVVKARVRDQMLDDGVDYVRASASSVALVQPSEAAVSIVPGGTFSSNALSVAAGTRVTWHNASGAQQALECTSAPYDFASGPLADGAAFETVLVEPGSYLFELGGGATCTVVVSGATQAARWLKAGQELHRFALAPALGGAASRVCYELRFRDWPGTVKVVTGCFDVVPVGVGAAFCAGDGSALACPCGNLGAAGHGCANSVDAAGGLLAAVGSASLAGDTVVLLGSGMPSAPVLYFQGTARQNGGLGAAFGDGLRCAAGMVVRLVQRTNVAGSSRFPGPQDQPLSQQGLVAAPGTRTYQAWYRNAASFCTADTFNLTNGLELVWAP
jgi:hypothetical protein